MASLPIYLEVEDIAVGPVMIALQKMPGILKMELKLGDAAPRPARQPGEPKGTNPQRIIALLVSRGGGPVDIAEIVRELGIPKGSAQQSFYELVNTEVVKRVDRGIYELSAKARRDLMGAAPASEAMKMLPKPRAAAATNGHSTIKQVRDGSVEASVLKLLLEGGGAVKVSDMTQRLVAERSMTDKGVASALRRAQSKKLAKSDGHGTWQLTDKGRKTAEAGVQ
jgi:Mn-dependent DtxR family transcriptional regulator